VTAASWNGSDELALGDVDGDIDVYTLGGRLLRRYAAHGGPVRAIAWSPVSHDLASGGGDGSLHVRGGQAGTKSIQAQSVTGPVRALSWSPDGRYLAVATDTLEVWDRVSRTRIESNGPSSEEILTSLAWSPNGLWLATSTEGGAVQIRETHGFSVTHTLLASDYGWASVSSAGAYKLDGDAAALFWYAMGMCRFEPGELDRYLPQIRRIQATDKFGRD